MHANITVPSLVTAHLFHLNHCYRLLGGGERGRGEEREREREERGREREREREGKWERLIIYLAHTSGTCMYIQYKQTFH